MLHSVPALIVWIKVRTAVYIAEMWSKRLDRSNAMENAMTMCVRDCVCVGKLFKLVHQVIQVIE